MSVLFVNDIAAGGHSSIEESLFYILVFGGQQIPQNRHNLWVLNESHISVTSKLQIPLERSNSSSTNEYELQQLAAVRNTF